MIDDQPTRVARFCGPLFILGSGRCGSTLLQRILNSFEDISLSGEHGGYLAALADSYFGTFQVSRSDGKSPLQRYRHQRRLLEEDDHWSAWTNWLHRDTVDAAYRDLAHRLLAPPGDAAAGCWGFKEIRYGPGDRVVDFLLRMFPSARFLVVARDPVDTLASMLDTGFFPPPELEQRAEAWAGLYRFFMDRAEENPETFFLLRFEDLVAPGYPGLHRVLDWLGRVPGDAQLRVIQAAGGRGESGVRKKSREPRDRFSSARLATIYRTTAVCRRELDYPITGALEPAKGLKIQPQGDAGCRLIHGDTVFALNGCAHDVVRLLGHGRDACAIVDELAQRYASTDRPTMAREVNELVERMFELGFVSVRGGG